MVRGVDHQGLAGRPGLRQGSQDPAHVVVQECAEAEVGPATGQRRVLVETPVVGEEVGDGRHDGVVQPVSCDLGPHVGMPDRPDELRRRREWIVRGDETHLEDPRNRAGRVFGQPANRSIGYPLVEPRVGGVPDADVRGQLRRLRVGHRIAAEQPLDPPHAVQYVHWKYLIR